VVWDIASNRPVLTADLRILAADQDRARRDGKWIIGIAFSPSGNYFAMTESNESSKSGTVIVYAIDRQSSTNPFRENTRIPVNDGEPYFLAFSHDEKFLAVSGRGIGVKLFNPRSGEAITKMVGESAADDSETGHLAFSPNDRWLAVSNLRGSIDLWDLEYRSVIGKFPLAESLVGLGFSTDGRQLITGDELLNSTVGYDLTIETWIARACSLARRDLTAEERQIYQLPSEPRTACSAP